MSDETSLPRDLAAEQAVLGAILADSTAFSLAAPILRAEDFSTDDHRHIYRAMIVLETRDASSVDVLTLADQLAVAGDRAIPQAYLTSLLDAVPDVANVTHYARIVRAKAQHRRLALAATRLQSAALDQDPEAVAEARAAIEKALASEDGDEATPRSEDAPARPVTPGEALRRSPLRGAQRINTGLKTIDEITGGLPAGAVVVVQGAPGSGKSTLASQIAARAVKQFEARVFLYCPDEGADAATKRIAPTTRQGLARIRSRKTRRPRRRRRPHRPR